MKNFAFATEENAELLLVLSLLSKKPVSLPFAADADAGMDFLRFLQEVTDGTSYEIENGRLVFRPGALVGGRKNVSVGSIGRLIAPLAVLGPFMKVPLSLHLEGVTNDEQSVDMLKTAYSFIFKAFGIPGASFNVKRRGFLPLGGGSVHIQMGTVRRLNSITLRETEMFDKVRGLVVTSRIGAGFTQRMVGTIKAEMESLGNVKVYNILGNKSDSGPSPGYECSVYVEGRSGVFYHTLGNGEPPEKMARECCQELLRGVDRGGVYDSKLLPTGLTLMALAWGVSHLKIGEADEDTRRVLDLLKKFLGVEYYLTREKDGFTVKIVGCGYVNPARPL